MGYLFFARVFLVILQMLFWLFGCARSITQFNDETYGVQITHGESKPKMLAATHMIPDSCTRRHEKLHRAECPKGYFCVARTDDAKSGSCRRECGTVVDDRLGKRRDVCEGPEVCSLLRQRNLSALGMFCVRQQNSRDMPCEAPLDENACADGLSCLPTLRTSSFPEDVFSHYRCKLECSLDKPCPNPDETCLFPKYARKVKQPGKGGKAQVSCAISLCQESHARADGCPCERALGYCCEQLIPGVDVGICVRKLGVCGIPRAPV
ncbi:MAG TPA: hypothetical protein VEL47_00690 [Myxococcota bacterium]|nr:hypothetical protein [Myxococcota bacterium]